MPHLQERKDRLERMTGLSVKSWHAATGFETARMKKDALVDMGWGRIIFGHTFTDNSMLYDTLCEEGEGKRDIAFYLRDPHVLLAKGPDTLFLDPSHTY